MSGPDANDLAREFGTAGLRRMLDEALPLGPDEAKPNGHSQSGFEEPNKSLPPAADPLIKSSAEFVRGFVPPDYLVDGLLQRRYCYALTARTGDGKTALALLAAACVALGVPFGGRECEKGSVLFFAGENPDDIRARWIAMSVAMSFDIQAIDVHFIPGSFKISALIERITAEVAALGGVSLIIVDTSAAYYESADDNHNVQQLEHAKRLRSLTNLPGGPTVLVNCHPAKNAADDNLCPRGGGSFVNEMDGNLTALRDDRTVVLHHQIKFRGPDFPPMNFLLHSDTYDRLRDRKKRLMPTVIAKPLSDAAQEEMVNVARSDEDQILQAIGERGGKSLVDLAKELGWHTPKHEPNKSKTQRTVNRLVRAGFVRLDRGRYALTDKGRKAVEK
jgi:AAA domain